MGSSQSYSIIDDDSDKNPKETTIYHELTITSIRMKEDYVIVNTSPAPFRDDLRLCKSNNNFIDLYNKLKIGFTYRFVIWEYIYHFYDSEDLCRYYVLEMNECLSHDVDVLVLGILNIEMENLYYYGLKNYEQIYFKDTENKRLMIYKDRKKDIVVGSKYMFTYEKGFGGNFYKITDYELIK